MQRMAWFVVLVLLAGLLLVRRETLADEPPDRFTPVAPASAIHAALQANLQITRDYLTADEFGSVAECANIVVVLAQLYSYQSTQSAFREKMAHLGETCNRLIRTAKDKDAPGCQKALRECDAILAELAKAPPQGAKAVDKDFKPAGALRTWMLLMDGTYADAKSAKTAKEVEQLAYTIAEGVNAVKHLKAEPRWREKALAVRESALQAAGKAHAGELDAAREALKGIYNRCESCHQTYKK